MKIKLYNIDFPYQTLIISIIFILLTPFVNKWLILIPFFIQIFRCLYYNEHIFMCDLAFLLPFSTIFMIPHWGTGIGTLIIFENLVLLISKRAFKVNLSIKILLFLITFIFLRTGNRYTDFIFIISSLLCVYLLLENITEYDSVRISYSFIYGVLISSIYGYIFRNSNQILSYITDNTAVSREFMELFRFRGLCLDSNYYSVFLIMAIILCFILYIINKMNIIKFVSLITCFSFFGSQTYSRTFFVLLIIFTFLSFYFLLKNRKYFMSLILFSIIVFFVIMTINGRIELFNVVLERLLKAKDVSQMTSGRTELWMDYLINIKNHIGTLLIGNKLNAKLIGGLGPHNIYIEILYTFGTVGFLLYFSYFSSLIKKVKMKYKYNYKENILAFFPVIIFLILYFTLQGIFISTTYIQLFIVISSMLLPLHIRKRD